MTKNELAKILFEKMTKEYPNKLDLVVIYLVDKIKFLKYLSEHVEADKDTMEEVAQWIITWAANSVSKDQMNEYFINLAGNFYAFKNKI